MTDLEKLFEKPANNVEKDIAEFLKPIMTEEQAAEAFTAKKSLTGCFKYTHDKARPKSDNVATPSYKQVMTWALEYFGFNKKGIAIPDAPGGTITVPSETRAASPTKAGAVNLDFDELFS